MSAPTLLAERKTTEPHEYDDDDAGKTAFVNEIASQSWVLSEMARKTIAYARDKLTIRPAAG